MTTSVFVSSYTQVSVRGDRYFDDSRSDTIMDINIFLLLGIVYGDVGWNTSQTEIASAEW